MKSLLNVTITGATGNIAKAFIPLLTNGLVFGSKTKINLRLNDIQPQLERLKGTCYEIEDGAYPLLNNLTYSSDLKESLDKTDVCIFIASYPHRAGMERKHLLEKNADIYKNIGQIMDSVSSKNCKTVVIANPVNSLTTILARAAPSINPKNFTGLSRLDFNRSRSLLARRYKTEVDQISNIIVWGNHSDTQYPDTYHVRVNGKKLRDMKEEQKYLATDYIENIRHRWKDVVESLGSTSVMSPANAVKDHLRDWCFGGVHDDYVSMAVVADGTYYSIPKGMAFSLPVVTKNFDYEVKKKFHVMDTEVPHKLIQDSIEEILKELDSIGYKL